MDVFAEHGVAGMLGLLANALFGDSTSSDGSGDSTELQLRSVVSKGKVDNS